MEFFKKAIHISFVCLIMFVGSSKAGADTSSLTSLNEISSKISETAAKLIPGEGVTEVNIEIKQDEKPDFTILGVRDLIKGDESNFFTQFSFHQNDIGVSERYIGNLGLGYRGLLDEGSLMYGLNIFYDQDIKNDHSRGSVGGELRGEVIEFNFNNYWTLSSMQKVGNDEEQSLDGMDYKLRSQIPHMPWTKFSWTGYKLKKDKSSQDTEGNIYELEMLLTPTLQLDLGLDETDGATGDQTFVQLNFVYPPREDSRSLVDGAIDDEIWAKSSMTKNLSNKVERQNNLFIEVQGSVIITKK